MTEATSRRGAGSVGAGWRQRMARLPLAEEGTHAMEQLLIVGATVVPCFVAILICERLIQEYLGFEVVILTSPFF